MFAIAKDARLQPADLAKLLKVNRVTVSMWFNGHTAPHRLLDDRVQQLLERIRQALETGDLPVPYDITRRERGHYIHKILGPRTD